MAAEIRTEFEVKVSITYILTEIEISLHNCSLYVCILIYSAIHDSIYFYCSVKACTERCN